ncbi:sedoheptulose 1,7-bisphosphatase / D-fructose 1,6-bisphosphatase [Trichormus variabilis ATCC 29413]|uniref:D-fructose 1,6-bisphosphatase class 2/sedoheptulose 1,7-bisphosphatase n=3 Tax=Nostocaceae TaxID=1162 RepID=FBSB_TRIV2|nr:MULTISPECIES: class II fructose-bisphosphatase [Nostocaceae]Q3M6T3.1 RecName: Full=D-fructose 1,6-bisphosphatase class 2/sedoheptulose 1,7-bisphosphatase; Short=FBPase class 2/SBPase [Trichormus variabilis ATCC 29413]MBD2254980.1 class II fructose-bisphosphatase [Nostoc parmelioides FACHB-3921]ABA23303.1 sedoheptulose 1,7-bisphosphatase / D-fructose 1,6-bisphosphatase [Trichormus variabilis ATCC 29413]MBC1216391.1 class II fructose-bisphosphatase [Trichormus variabilis ARAD]MBC1258652.1 cla
MENTLGLEIIEVVEQAAIASAKWMGKGEKNTADQVAVEAMRERMNKIYMRGRIVIGEGERDDAPMLYIGEEVGICTQPNADQLCNPDELVEIDIAVDPCEGTNLVAYGQPGSMAVLAISEKGGLFAAPDFYMKKLAAPPAAKGKVDINKSATENLKILSECLDRAIDELVVVVMKRDRHQGLIKEIRDAGARVQLISDGDVGAAISCGFAGTNIHALMGIGAAPEGVISAAAMRALGGHFQGQLIYDPEVVKTGLIGESKEANLERLSSMGINDPDKVYDAHELASGETVLFAACGITSGNLMQGVRFFHGGARTQSLVISSQSQTARFVDTIHMAGQPKTVQLH